MARKPRIIQTQYPYHLTIRTNNKVFRFQQKKAIRLFATTLTTGAKKYSVRLHHFLLMSNHYHLIVWADEPNIHRFMQYVNSLIARRFNQIAQRSGHLWQDRYRSCIIDTDDHYTASVRYVYRNPVRAGMVEKSRDFEDSTFCFVAFGKPVDIFVVEDHLVVRFQEDRQARARFFLQLVGDEEPSLADQEVKRGLRKLFFGSADFIERMTQTHLNS